MKKLLRRVSAWLSAGLLMAAAVPSGTVLAYGEAPMLAALVSQGKLPPVDERLPLRPRVITAVEVGTYGGTWRRAFNGPGDRWGPTKLMEERVIKWQADAAGNPQLVPGYIERHRVNHDSTEFTFTLLEGLKWSDGHPVTTADVSFWYNDVFLNKALTPTIDPTLAPGGQPLQVQVIDQRTFKVIFQRPYVQFLAILAKDSTSGPSLDRPSFLFPRHYLERFHASYAAPEALAARTKALGAKRWTDLWGTRGAVTAWWSNPDLPVLTAWKVETPAPAQVVTMVRNPYYYAVDQAGNQLPYIDRVEHRLFEAQEAFNLMVVQGQIDLQLRNTNTNDFTFYKEHEARGGYKIIPWRTATTWSLIPNLNTENPVLSAFFGDRRVRRALSVAIDRALINELAFSGLAQARQVAPIQGSPNFSTALERHWTAYDPDLANRLLDEAGYATRDNRGFRTVDGARLRIVVEATSDAQSTMLELLTRNFAEVGLEILPRIIDRTQWAENRANNTFDMHLYPFDGLTLVAADPRKLLGRDTFARRYYVWYATHGASGTPPPPDHPIRTLWALWDEASTAGTLAASDAAIDRLVAGFVSEGWAIGVIGEEPRLAIVSARFRNFRGGLIEDDITRGLGVAVPQQMWLATEH